VRWKILNHWRRGRKVVRHERGVEQHVGLEENALRKSTERTVHAPFGLKSQVVRMLVSAVARSFYAAKATGVAAA
jgi:hypothetical protein